MPLSRRSFILGGAASMALAACADGDKRGATQTTTTTPVTVPTTRAASKPLVGPPFTLGVASGEPDATSVVLWTRLAPAEGDHDVTWEVASDDRFAELAAAGAATATPDDGHSVHVVADGLEPDTWYWYRFTAGIHSSPVGRTRTAPDGDSARLRFAFASCQNWQDGLYTAHEHLAREDLDLVVFLGDYIYEGGIDRQAVRMHDRAEVTTLSEYRTRYALYKGDLNLQASHARAPWFVIWDDHEVDNNYANDVDPVRRAAAYKAWWEHQATRLPKPEGSAFVAYRTLRWGRLATFFGLDGRQHRDDQPCGRGGDLGDGCPERDDPARTMLGAAQEAWVAKELRRSRSTWNVVANQTILSPSGVPIGDGDLFNLDQWDGYPAARARLLDALATASNPVVVTGDIHAGAVGDIRRDDQVVGVELVGPAVSSSFPAQYADLFELAARAAGAAMVDARHNGYVVCELSPEALVADYRVVSTTQAPTSSISTLSSWKITAGTPGVKPLA